MAARETARITLERSRVPICIFDRNGRYELVSDGAETLLAATRVELVGCHYRESGPTRRDPAFDRAFCELLVDSTPRSLALELDHRAFTLELSAGADQVLVVWREVTDPQTLERDRWRGLFEQAPAHISITLGPEHRFAFVNARGRDIVGGREDLVGRTAREAFPALAGSPLMSIVDEVYETGQSWTGTEVQLPFLGPESEERYFTLIHQPFRGAGEAITGIMTFGFEVTAAVRARHRLETLFNANLIGNIAWKLDGTITQANDAFLATVGYDRRDLVAGQLSWRALTPSEYDPLDDQLVYLLRTERSHRPTEKEYLRKDQSRVPVLVSSALFSDSDDEGISYIVDLTTVKQAEQRIRDLLTEAQAASRAKDEFLAMLGHELRNPLAPITTAIELMQLRNMDTPELPTLVRQVAHMSRLVDDLLDVARIARGEITIDRRSVDVRRVVERAVEMAEPLIDRQRHRLTLRVAEEPLRVQGDEARLAQAVSNLLVNAARYTPVEGEIELGVSREGEHIRIRVRDNGQGITPELLGRVFELFVRSPSEDSRHQGGLGLGLAIVRNIVRLHGGEVVALSDGQGQGSEFTITIPGQAPAPEAAAPAKAADASVTDCCQILLVHDSHDGAELLAVLLRHHGHEVQVAHTGPAALRLVDGFTPSVAILDLGLPIMDGFELARALRARFGPRLRLIALTGYGQARDREKTAAAGFDEHLVKPVMPDAILGALRQL